MNLFRHLFVTNCSRIECVVEMDMGATRLACINPILPDTSCLSVYSHSPPICQLSFSVQWCHINSL